MNHFFLQKISTQLIRSSGYLLAKHSEIKTERGTLILFSFNCDLKLSLVSKHKKSLAHARLLWDKFVNIIIPRGS